MHLPRGVVPCRDPMSPPELATDAPVLDVFQPGKVGVLPFFGDKTQLSPAHGFHGRYRQFPGPDEPLVGEQGFDDGSRTVPPGDGEGARLHFFHQPLLLQIADDLLPGLEAVQSSVGCGGAVVNGGRGTEDVEGRQLVPLSRLIVIEVMGRGDLDAAAAELGVHHFIHDHRNRPAGQRQDQFFARQFPVAWISGVNGYGTIAQHRFGPGSGHGQVSPTVCSGVAQIIEKA